MTKKTKILLVIAAIVAVLAVAVAGVLIWFFSPGVHVLFGFVHIDITMEGNILQDSDVIGKAPFKAVSTAAPASLSSFSSLDHIEIGGCPALTEKDDPTIYTMEHSDGIMAVVYSLPLLAQDPETGDISFDGGKYYFIYIDKETKEIISASCQIDSDENGDTECYVSFEE